MEDLQTDRILEKGSDSDDPLDLSECTNDERINITRLKNQETAVDDYVTKSDMGLEAIKLRLRQLEEESKKLKQRLTKIKENMEVDARSIYVENVDYGATAVELEQHFQHCGSINRVTILGDKQNEHPRGFAYIEYADREAANTAIMVMDKTYFHDRQINVMPMPTKRPKSDEQTNKQSQSGTDEPPQTAIRVVYG